MTDSADSPVLVEHLFRHQAGRLVARLTGLLGPAHVDLAEESVQEAMVRALETWPYQGVPDNAAGWLFRTDDEGFQARLAQIRERTKRQTEGASSVDIDAPPDPAGDAPGV